MSSSRFFLVTLKIIELDLSNAQSIFDIAWVMITAINILTYYLWSRIKRHIADYDLYLIGEQGNERKLN
jgi:hypothetical protein